MAEAPASAVEVSLREITPANVYAVLRLKVSDAQRGYVADNAASLAEAAYKEEAWARAIYADDVPVGFLMLYDETLRSDPAEVPEVMLWRLMVDARHQGRGYARQALDQVIQHLRSRAVKMLEVSYVPGEGSPLGFYEKLGFTETGREVDGERVMALRLDARAGDVLDPTALVAHKGSCHCGAVTFEVRAPREVAVHECNCSMCSRVGYLHLIVPRSRFTLLQGEDSLTTYRFNSGVAQHTFCRVCGVKPFYVPRSNPDGISVNFRCLRRAGFNDVTTELIDGRNWEQAAAALRHLSEE
jgi:GNAT superfamily N-acetyltransferase